MAMTQRERYLAIGVGVTVGLFGVQFLYSSLQGELEGKRSKISAAQNELNEMLKTETSGKLAVQQMEQITPMSLPTNVETLIAQYKSWLLEIGQQAGLEDINVQVPERPAMGSNEAYTAYNFTLTGTCSSDQTVDLLGLYYAKNYLHTARSFKVTLSPREVNVVDVTLESQVLALRTAAPDQEPPSGSSQRLAMSIDDYKSKIFGRNPFAPPNNPPRLATSRTHSINRGESWSLDLDANDPDQDGVRFELISTELPEGMEFNGNQLTWKPEENGEYQVEIRAIDSGLPSMSAEEQLVFTVVDPPVEAPKEEPPKFDAATQAFVSAILRGRNGPEAWIRSRVEGETKYLKKGSDFEVGTVKAKVIDINLNEDFIELESEDGRRWTVGMDMSIAEAYGQGQID